MPLLQGSTLEKLALQTGRYRTKSAKGVSLERSYKPDPLQHGKDVLGQCHRSIKDRATCLRPIGFH
jgi:hypothetical protein